jgi:hypothetical protein
MLAHPCDILFDPNRKSGRESAVYPVGEAAFVGIAIVCVEQGNSTRQDGRLRGQRHNCRTKENDYGCSRHILEFTRYAIVVSIRHDGGPQHGSSMPALTTGYVLS